MDLLLNPNVAYLLLVAAMLSLLVAIVVPGTGVPEVITLFAFLLAAYAVYSLSFNWWALALLVLSLIPFILATRGPRRDAWLVIAILGLTAGLAFFFPAKNGLLAIHPALAGLTSALFGVFLWVSVRKVVQVSQTRPVHELSLLIGEHGEAKTAIGETGSVQVGGELWSARSPAPIPAGVAVRVVGREGFILLVERENHS